MVKSGPFQKLTQVVYLSNPPPPPLYFAEFGALNWGKGKDAVCEDNAKDAVSVVLLPSTTCTTPPPPISGME